MTNKVHTTVIAHRLHFYMVVGVWLYQKETFSVLLAHQSPVDSPHTVTRSFDILLDLRLNLTDACYFSFDD